ncbi:MAG: DUF2344 domain-containing protein [Planctomycetes bacterium]|nr:DUF2344 domain-containing protein [Planctomycetota bacterium]MBL7009089.1 DUF2344 domain-containing protein [Planctomycetota bacterium]
MSGSQEPAFRCCVEFSKGGAARFLSHLDLQAAVERALRRARLPLAFSQGFQPRPKLQFEEALPLGWRSDLERLWVDLRVPYPCREAAKRLARTLPDGVRLLRMYPAPGRPQPPVARSYRVRGVEFAPEALEGLGAAFPVAAADPASAVVAVVDAGGTVFHLRPRAQGGAPSLKKVIRFLLGGDPGAELEVLRLASGEDDA